MGTDQNTSDIRHFNRYFTNKLGLLARYRFDTKLTLTEARVLLEIGRRGIHTQGALGTELSIDGGYLSRVIAKLEDLGLIKKRKDWADGRIVLMELSAKGLEQISHIDSASDDDVRAMTGILSGPQKDELIGHMRAIERILEGYGEMAPSIGTAQSVQDIAAARMLMREYIASLGENLSFQNVERELAKLPGGYAPPDGALLVARMPKRSSAEAPDNRAGEPAGCVALHRIGDDACEMKRLYVRPEFRGYGIGSSLTERIIDNAKSLGYARMRLDTLSRLGDAVRLYRKFGFREIEPYYHNPLEGALFFEKLL